MWGANLAGKYVVCRSDKTFTPHPTISAVPLPDAALTRLIRPTFRFGRCQRITRHCGPLLPQRSLALLESNLPAPGSSHPLQAAESKKPARRLVFLNWSVIEDYSPLRGSPCGPLLAQRSLASLESNLPAPGGSHPHGLQMQKSLLAEQAFRIWSVIEDSNLRPLRPERSALPGCANHRMRGASYCADTPSSIP